MKTKAAKCLETYIRAYESRLKNNNLELHMVLYSCEHCFEFNPYTKEIRPFNSIFWYSLDHGNVENKYSTILNYLKLKHDAAIDKYPYNFTPESIGIIMENTLAVDLEKLVEDIIPNDDSISQKSKSRMTLECIDLMKSIEKLYSNWRDIMLFVLNNYDHVENISITNWRK